MNKPWIVAIGASAGGVAGLSTILDNLSECDHLALVVTMHMPSEADGYFGRFLRRISRWPVLDVSRVLPLHGGIIYASTPNAHLAVGDKTVVPIDHVQGNHWHPDINPMLSTTAITHGANAIGIVLSGRLDDGAAGLLEIRKHGGLAIVQDPLEAACSEMPSAAIQTADPHLCLSLAQIHTLLSDLAVMSTPRLFLRRLKNQNGATKLMNHRGEVKKTAHPRALVDALP